MVGTSELRKASANAALCFSALVLAAMFVAFPLQAHAAHDAGGSLPLASATKGELLPLGGQFESQAASKTKVWVLASCLDTKYKYNKKGQLVQATFGGSSKNKRAYTYENDRIVTVKEVTGSHVVTDFDAELTYDKKGRLKKAVTVGGGYNSGGCIETYGYNAKDQIVKIALYDINGKATGTLYKYKYDKNGRISLVTQITSNKQKNIYSYKYDTRGNVKKSVAKHSYGTETTSYSNKYKNGCLVSRNFKTKSSLSGVTRTGTIDGYKYKRISISREYAPQVRFQQEELLRSFTHLQFLY